MHGLQVLLHQFLRGKYIHTVRTLLTRAPQALLAAIPPALVRYLHMLSPSIFLTIYFPADCTRVLHPSVQLGVAVQIPSGGKALSAVFAAVFVFSAIRGLGSVRIYVDYQYVAGVWEGGGRVSAAFGGVWLAISTAACHVYGHEVFEKGFGLGKVQRAVRADVFHYRDALGP